MRGRSVLVVDDPPERPPWTETSTIEVNGGQVTIQTSNVPPPGTPLRLYWFSAPPTTDEDAGEVSSHIEELHVVKNRANADSA
jgi:hypothetical protein